MPPERDNIIPFPVPPTRLLRVLLAEVTSTHDAQRIALRLIQHAERTAHGERCPWCRHPQPRASS